LALVIQETGIPVIFVHVWSTIRAWPELKVAKIRRTAVTRKTGFDVLEKNLATGLRF